MYKMSGHIKCELNEYIGMYKMSVYIKYVRNECIENV